VNIKPLIPGHVLVVPHKPYKRLTDLSPPELTDLFRSVQRVQRMLARHYFTTASSSARRQDSKAGDDRVEPAAGTPEAGSFNIAIQDGSEAGQTVPHLHVHVIPRIRGATEKPGDGPSDTIYEHMAAEEGNVGGKFWDRWAERRPQPGGGFPRIEDADREARTIEEMEEEADTFRRVLREVEDNESAS
jgi:bis(5'-adenosyl)-triphosphatase